jgi:hypothetical protein
MCPVAFFMSTSSLEVVWTKMRRRCSVANYVRVTHIQVSAREVALSDNWKRPNSCVRLSKLTLYGALPLSVVGQFESARPIISSAVHT